jgi:hypothetical protein
VFAAPRVELPAHDEPWTTAVAVTITHYFNEVSFDVDNLPKPILDGIKGLVIEDDAQVTDLVVRKRRAVGDHALRDPSPALAGALAREAEFVRILVEEVPTVGDER